MAEILWDLVGTPIKKTVMDAPGVSDALEAADGMIPDDFKDIMSINDMFEELITSVLSDVIVTQVFLDLSFFVIYVCYYFYICLFTSMILSLGCLTIVTLSCVFLLLSRVTIFPPVLLRWTTTLSLVCRSCRMGMMLTTTLN